MPDEDEIIASADETEQTADITDEAAPVGVWDYLAGTDKPIVMYGMGDGAVKIMCVMNERGINPAEFMASDEFVRGHSFMGYRVKKLSEIEEQYGDFIIVICFGTQLPELMEKIYALSEKYEVLVPDVPVKGDGLITPEYLRENAEKIERVKAMLADDVSRYAFDKIMEYRLTGRLQPLREITTPKAEAEALLRLGGKETFVDLGAFSGDTIADFLRVTGGSYNEIYAFEPDIRSYTKLLRRHHALDPKTLIGVNAAAWSEDAEVEFVHKAGRNSAVGGKGRLVKTPARSVDSVLGGKAATLIKLDVEGCEREAIMGAEKTIKRYRPKMIVSLYHRTDDMLELPLLIRELNPRAKLFLRHHPYIPAWDTNLYCV